MEQEDFLRMIQKQQRLVGDSLQLMEVLNERTSANKLKDFLQDLKNMDQEHQHFLAALNSLPEPQLNENAHVLFQQAMENTNTERERATDSNNSSTEDRDSAPEEENMMDGDRSILLSQVEGIPIDPITQNKIKQPARNNVCNHVYEHDVIISYLKQQAFKGASRARKRKVRCPYIGCTNEDVLEEHIVMDDQLRKKIVVTMNTDDITPDMSFVDIN